MEEDIKILENYIYGKKETMKEQLVVAIENLIKAYKELEENISKEHTLGYSQGVYDCSEAWKETIKEKIEEWKKRLETDERLDWIIRDKAIINVLDELLGEEK